jgi:antirestriction protein ArdC
LEKGEIPWQKPWRAGWPCNLFSKRRYGLLNAIVLNVAGFGSPYWATRKQIEAHKGRVRKSQLTKSNTVYYTRLNTFVDWVIPGEMGSKELGVLFKEYTVWNVEQTQGLERYVPQPEHSVPIDEAEKLIKKMPLPVTIKRNPGRACYYPRDDYISVPSLSQFFTEPEYYSTLFHELIHATGHTARLNRKTLAEATKFGDHSYSQEELVAEMGAAMLCGLSGIAPKTVENSAAYIQHWLGVLKKDRTVLFQAIAQGKKACGYIRDEPATPEPAKVSGKADSQVELLTAEVLDAVDE